MCDIGYSGSFCQFKGSQLNDFTIVSTNIVNALLAKLTSVPEITPNEIELVAAIFRGILKDPDVVDDSMLESMISMLEMIGSASIYAHYPITINTRDAYMDSLSGMMNKIFHSYKVKRAVANVVKLASQQSITSQYAFISGQSRRRMLSSADYLITGVGERLASLLSSSSDGGGSLYQRYGRRFDEQLNLFIEKFLPKLNPIYPTYSYSSTVIQLLV